jgi:hypothetical protein
MSLSKAIVMAYMDRSMALSIELDGLTADDIPELANAFRRAGVSVLQPEVTP